LKLCIVCASCFVQALPVCFFANMESKVLSFPTSLRLRFIFFLGLLKEESLRPHTYHGDSPGKSHPAFIKSQHANTKVSRRLAGQTG
jgi:hypothetical protein